MERSGKGGDENAPSAWAAFHINFAAVCLSNGLSQTESQAVTRLWSAWVTPIESLKNMGEVLFRNTGPRIFDRDGNPFFALSLDRDINASIR